MNRPDQITEGARDAVLDREIGIMSAQTQFGPRLNFLLMIKLLENFLTHG